MNPDSQPVSRSEPPETAESPDPAAPAVFTVAPEEENLRIDQVLAARFTDHSRGYFQHCIDTGLVRIDGRRCRRATRVRAGERVEVDRPLREVYEVKAEPVAFEIIHEDDDVLVINKPPGLVVHPAHGNLSGTLVHGLMFRDREHFAEMDDETHRPGIVHRLDKDTSGVMIVARNLAARAFLKKAFKERRVEKTYLAVVIGEFGGVTGTVENRIGRNPRNRMKMAVVPDGKHALTKYRVLGTAGGCSLLEVRIFTGRTHQIRVHFSHLNHPILGDGLYGGKQKQIAHQPPRQLLHAWKLTFPHPRTGIMREYMGPIPDDFVAALEALGLPVIGRHPTPAPPAVPEEIDPEDTDCG